MISFSFFRNALLVLILSCFSISTFAADSIPRTDLRLELMLATGTQDTSGTNRIITTSGSAISFLNDTTYGIRFGNFNGSGGLRLNTGWTTSNNDFTVSFWMQHNGTGSFLTGATNITGPMQVKWYPPCGSCGVSQMQETYSTNIAQTIFTSGEDNTIKFIMDNSGKCSIRGGKGTIQTSSVFMGSYYSIGFKTFEVGNNLQESFNCSTLMDNKWHNVVLLSKSGSTSVYVDGNEITKLAGAIPVGKYITIGSSDTNILTYSGNFLPNQIPNIVNSKFLRGNLTTFRIYSRALNDNELESIFDEFRYAQSELMGAGGIEVNMERYTKPNLYTLFKNIPVNLSKNDVTYEFSTDGLNYTPIADITDISTSTGFIAYRMNVDLSGKPDGKITVTYRIRATNDTFQNIGTISFIKMDITTGIIITMPNSDTASSKTITAEAPGSELKMLVTLGTTCDATLGTGAFENYSDLVLTNKIDNGKRVCYRAYYSNINKLVFRLSAPITGIQPGDSIMSNIFDDYLLWAKSSKPKLNDSAFLVLGMLGYNTTNVTGTAANGITMTDINGDGLVDFLYSKNDLPRRAIIVNNGNYTFKTVYKCAIDPAGNNYSAGVTYSFPTTTYYGDCADTSR